MLTRAFRLSRPETSLVLRTGRRHENSFVKVRVGADFQGEEPKAKFAILVPTASAPLASARQRLKRRTRHIISQLLPKIKSGQAIVIMLKKPAAGLGFEKLKEEIKEILQEAKIL